MANAVGIFVSPIVNDPGSLTGVAFAVLRLFQVLIIEDHFNGQVGGLLR